MRSNYNTIVWMAECCWCSVKQRCAIGLFAMQDCCDDAREIHDMDVTMATVDASSRRRHQSSSSIGQLSCTVL